MPTRHESVPHRDCRSNNRCRSGKGGSRGDRKGRGGQGPKILRLVVGNPLIMKEMAKTVPDSASYALVSILVDERTNGVHLSYDSMASLIAPYGSQAALMVARDLDAKIEGMLETAAR